MFYERMPGDLLKDRKDFYNLTIQRCEFSDNGIHLKIKEK